MDLAASSSVCLADVKDEAVVCSVAAGWTVSGTSLELSGCDMAVWYDESSKGRCKVDLKRELWKRRVEVRAEKRKTQKTMNGYDLQQGKGGKEMYTRDQHFSRTICLQASWLLASS